MQRLRLDLADIATLDDYLDILTRHCHASELGKFLCGSIQTITVSNICAVSELYTQEVQQIAEFVSLGYPNRIFLDYRLLFVVLIGVSALVRKVEDVHRAGKFDKFAGCGIHIEYQVVSAYIALADLYRLSVFHCKQHDLAHIDDVVTRERLVADYYCRLGYGNTRILSLILALEYCDDRVTGSGFALQNTAEYAIGKRIGRDCDSPGVRRHGDRRKFVDGTSSRA